MNLIVDHVCYGTSDLPKMQRKFSVLGLTSVYGGAHASVTHMGIVGFADGSYLELIAPEQPDRPMPTDQRWGKLMLENAGPCGWAVRVPNLKAELDRLRQTGTSVAGPFSGRRTKPDGKCLRWETGWTVPGDPGSLLPFNISDITSLRDRVTVASSALNRAFVGVSKVLIGVSDLPSSIRQFQEVYDLGDPDVSHNELFSAEIAFFPQSPVILARPLGSSGWLSERISRYGNRPFAFLLATNDLTKAVRDFALSKRLLLREHQTAWFDPDLLGGFRLGAVQL